MLKEVPFANALGVVMAVFYLVCRLLAALFPDFFRLVADSWFHGYDLSVIPVGGMTFGGFLIGLVTATAAAWIFGYSLAWAYNKLSK